MLQMILSEWIVRVFLAYLLLVGAIALIRRERPTLCLPFDLVCLPGIGERWAGRGEWCAVSRANWWKKCGLRIGYVERHDTRLCKKSDGNGLTYA
jgi:hypothetical protein